MILEIDGSELLHHRLLEQLPDRSCFLSVHGSLVSQTHVVQHGVWIKSLADGVLEILHEGSLIASIGNVIGHHFSLFHVLDADIIFTERKGGNGLFVRVLAVNDGS